MVKRMREDLTRDEVEKISPPPQEIPLLKEFVSGDGGYPCHIDLELAVGSTAQRLVTRVGNTVYSQWVQPDLADLVHAAFTAPWIFVRYDTQHKVTSIRFMKTFGY